MTANGPAADRHALIIGAMKSGTTSLFEILAQHPEIAAARIKEPDFFSDPAVFEQGWDWYRGLWDRTHPSQVALEASVSYTKAPIWPDVPERIASMPNADLRFIYMIRHPITRISSQVRHSIFEGWGASLDEGIPEDAIEFTRYAAQLDRYLEHFPRSSFLVVTLEEFSTTPNDVLRRICSFLEIDPDFAFAEVERRYNKGDLYGVSGFWSSLLHLKPLRSLAETLLPRSVRHSLRDMVAGLGRSSGPATESTAPRYELNDVEQAEVLSALAPDLLRLRDEYGVDAVAHWDIDVG